MNNTETIDGKLMDEATFIENATKWANMIKRQAKANAATFTKGKKAPRTYRKGIHAGKTEEKLSTTIKHKIRKRHGEFSHVGFIFPVHGVFRALGVGHGQPAPGSGKRKAQKMYVKRTMNAWLSDPLEKKFNKFTEIVVEYFGDKVIGHVYGMKKNTNIK
jgi:hypothetical protein